MPRMKHAQDTGGRVEAFRSPTIGAVDQSTRLSSLSGVSQASEPRRRLASELTQPSLDYRQGRLCARFRPVAH